MDLSAELSCRQLLFSTCRCQLVSQASGDQLGFAINSLRVARWNLSCCDANFFVIDGATGCHNANQWCCWDDKIGIITTFSFSVLKWENLWRFHCLLLSVVHDDAVALTHFLHYWPFVRGIHWSPVDNAKHWFCLCCYFEQAVEQTVFLPLIWDPMMVIWHHSL